MVRVARPLSQQDGEGRPRKLRTEDQAKGYGQARAIRGTSPWETTSTAPPQGPRWNYSMLGSIPNVAGA